MKKNKIAVCIAAYNFAQFLPELLESLKKQTFKDFRVYISYNGSTDNTLEVLKKWKKQLPLTIVKYSTTPGIGLNKYDVVERALKDNPEYIQMIDADDIVLPTFLEKVVARMDVGDIDWCLCWGQLFGDRSGYIHSEIEPLEKLLKENHRHSWITSKADVFSLYNYDPKIKYAEDLDLWVRLDKAGYRGDLVKEELYRKRWHNKNLTSIHTVVRNSNKLRFHLLGLVHLPVSEKYMGCAFTQKIVKLSKMLLSLGHEVILYGSESSDAPCSKFVQTHTLNDIKDAWGDGDNRFELGYDWETNGFRHDFNSTRTETTKKYYQSCVNEINKIKKQNDFLLITQGVYQQPIYEGVELYLTCEPGVGYRGSSNKSFRAFESAYLQNFTYGSEHPRECINGNYYDVVLPNFFDNKDFIYSDKSKNYYFYIGRIISRKGVWTAIKATKEIDAKLILVGQTSDEINVNSLPSNCEFQGFADVEKRKSLLSGAIATFVPSIYLEAFGGTHIESRLSGTPVLTTDFGVFPGTVENGVDGFRCSTLDDFVWAAKECKKLDRVLIRKRAERYLMDNVKWEYQKWFEDLYQLFLSAINPKTKGWHHIRTKQAEWRRKIYGDKKSKI